MRLLKTVFEPQKGERTCVLIDLDDPMQVKDFTFLQNPALTVQKYAHDIFYQGLNNGVGHALGLTGGELYAYRKTGGSNLDMDDLVIDTQGRHLSFEKDIYPKYDIILCCSYRDWETDRKSTRLNSSHLKLSRMPSSA